MKAQGNGSGRKIGLLGCLAFWVLAGAALLAVKRSPAAAGAFAAVQEWLGWLRERSPGLLAAVLGLVAATPAAIVWLLWRRFKRGGGGKPRE